MKLTDFKSIRIRPELRSTQVDETADMVPAQTFYFSEKYDLGQTRIPSHCVKVSFIECLRLVAASDAVILDIPEPLWLRFAFRNLCIVSVWKISGLLRRRRREVVAYAIENNSIEYLLLSNRIAPRVLVRLFCFVYGLIVFAYMDRIVYGSSASRKTYFELKYLPNIRSILIEELPTAVDCRPNDDTQRPGGTRAIFVGELDDRKGILDLLEAWERVERELPGARLDIIGSGPYRSRIESWCSHSPNKRIYKGFVEHADIRSIMADCHVLVAPSRRQGRWREQIGLPIAEALSVGLTVVTTDETGLADWLSDHGHYVVPEMIDSGKLAESILSALQAPLARSSVTGSLPETAARIAADHWLHKSPPSTRDNGGAAI